MYVSQPTGPTDFSCTQLAQFVILIVEYGNREIDLHFAFGNNYLAFGHVVLILLCEALKKPIL